jgi:hypothetical protein
MREQARSISRGLKINKNSAEGGVFLVDFPSYRTSQACKGIEGSRKMHKVPFRERTPLLQEHGIVSMVRDCYSHAVAWS